VRLDHHVFSTFAAYWNLALIPENWAARLRPRGVALFWVLTLALVGLVAREISKARFGALFGGLWFLATLAPMLVIPDHVTNYYVTIPLIGLSMAAALGVVSAWRARWQIGAAVTLLAAGWTIVMVEGSLIATHWWMDRSQEVRALVLGVEAAQKAHPGKILVLDGVTSDLYNNAVGDLAFYPAGLDYVYLTPGSGDKIVPRVSPELLRNIVLEPAVMRNAITHEDVVVYSVLSDHLRNITEAYERSTLPRLFLDGKSVPRRVDAGNPLFGYLLGPEWLGLESGVRWMPGKATVRLGGPLAATDKLLLQGYCPEQQLKAGPVHVAVSVDGIPLQGAEIGDPENDFRRLFDVPASLVGRPSVEVSISVDRVMHEAGGRELGLVFGTIGFEP
jgi:hypothetical protein